MQSDLFGAQQAPPETNFPEGFRYRRDLIGEGDEQQLVAAIRQLPFKPFEFHGYLGNRRTVSFGWRYDFGAHQLNKADDIPEFLLDLRARAAEFAALEPAHMQQALVTEYAPGAGIGWHRDRPEFGEVIGVSLLSSCVFRLRRKSEDKWERVNLTAEPRSVYLLSGSARS